MRSIRPLIAVVCAIFVTSAAFPQANPKDKWLKLTTPNFTIVSNSPEKEARLVATKLEQFRTAFKSLFPNAVFTSAIPTNVVVFKSSSSYKPYKPKRGDGKADEWIAGYFQPGEDVNYITLSTEGEDADVYGTIFHEYVHSLLNTTFGKSQVPPWFNEGLAEYYQTFEIREDRIVSLGKLQEGHLQLLQRSKLIPFKDFFAVTNYSLHQNGNHSRSIFYAQAWALIHYLIQGNGGANGENLGKFLSRVMNNESPESAFQKTFGSDYATMEKALDKYVEQRSFRGTMVTFKNKLIFDDQFAVAPISTAQANAYLGDLLYHTHEFEAADLHLRKALEEEPDLSSAHTSLGLVKMRQRDFAAAKSHLERAMADDQKNHYAYYNYAYVLSREAMDEFGYVREYPPETAKKMRESLKRSIELNPEFPDSYRMLAFVYMITGEDLDEALATLKKGVRYQPGSQQFELLMAQIYLRQEKYNEAKAIADRLAKTAEDDAMRANAAQIASTVSQYEEAKRNATLAVSADQPGGASRPILVKRSSMTDEEYAKLERDREIRNLNIMMESPAPDERRTVGRIEKVSCPRGEVTYAAVGQDGKLTLNSKDFQSLKLMVLHEGTSDVSIGCDADIKDELVVMTYKPSGAKNILTALHFVPPDFKLLTPEEIASAPNIIIQGGPPTDLKRNAEVSAKQLAEMEEKREQMMLERLSQSLRQPSDGELRLIGSVQKIECSGKEAVFQINGPGGLLKLKAPPSDQLKIVAYTPDAGGLRFSCGVSYPTLSAVVTYRPVSGRSKKLDGDLVSLEFVPSIFKLPAEN